MEKIIIQEDRKIIEATKAMLCNSRFNDVDMSGVHICNANLTNLEIEGAQIGGAFIHNIGGAPEGHPAFDPNFKQRLVRFEDCDLNGSTFTNCNLSGVTVTDSNLNGMTINGVSVEDLLRAYAKNK